MARVEIEVVLGTTASAGYPAGTRFMLDTFDSEPIPITFQISDIQSIESTNSSYTKTITLPETEHNREVFGFISDLNSTMSSGNATLQQVGGILNVGNPASNPISGARKYYIPHGGNNPYVSFNPNKKARCYILCDSVIVMEGYIQLAKVINKDNLNTLECVCYADNDNLWTNLGDNLLTDIDWSHLNHEWTIENIVNSWSKNVDTLGYYYPLIDYGESGAAPNTGNSGDWTLSDITNPPPDPNEPSSGVVGGVLVDNMFPATYVKHIIDNIFQQAGYQYNSNFFNSQRFKNLIVPFCNKNMTMAQDPAFTFRAGMGYITGGPTGPAQQDTWTISAGITAYGPLPVGNYRTGNLGGIGNQFNIFSPLDYHSPGVRVRMYDTTYPNADYGANWDPVFFDYHQIYATSSNGNTFSTCQRFMFQFDITEWLPTGMTHWAPSTLTFYRSRKSTGATGAPDGSYPHGYYPGAYKYTSGVPNQTNAVPAPQANTPITIDKPSTANSGGVDAYTFYFPSNPYNFVHGDPPNQQSNLNTVGNDIVATFVTSSTGVPGYNYKGLVYTKFTPEHDANGDPLSGYGVQDYSLYSIFPGEHVWVEYQGFHRATSTINSPVPVVTFNSDCTMWNEWYPNMQPKRMIDYNSVIPAKIKQRDFLLSIIKMFNLFVEPDKNNPNTLKIEPRDDYYAQGVIRDWTNRVDRNQNIEIQVLAETQNKITTFTYKDDKDYYNTDYTESYGQSFGSYKYVIDNDFLIGEKKVDCVFSPTPLIPVENSKGYVIPKILKWNNGIWQSTDSNPRILQRTTAGVITNRYNEQPWRLGYKGELNNALKFPYYPYAGHFDNPYDPDFDLNWGQTQKVWHGQNNATENNLFNNYWKKMMDEYTDPDSRLVTMSMYLTPLDISQFSFADAIFIDEQYYKVVKIDGYDPSQRTTCKVTLLKTLDITVPKTVKRWVAGPVGVGTSLSTQYVGIAHIGKKSALGTNHNVILESGSGAIGYNNLITNKHTFITGYNNVAPAYGTFIHGQGNFTSASASIPFIKGSLNQIGDFSYANIFGSSNTIGTGSNIHIVGDNNFIYDVTYATSSSLVTIFGHDNVVGTNSTTTHIIGSNNIVYEAVTSSVTHILGSNNTIYPTGTDSTISGAVTHVVGNDNTVYPSGTSSLSTVFGSVNTLGTGSVVHIVGSGNTVADAVTQSIVLGSNNTVGSSLATVFGSDNAVGTQSNAKILGSNITFDQNVTNSVAIGKNIFANQSNKVYISDAIFTSGGTGSALGLPNTLDVNSDPSGRQITGTFTVWDNQINIIAYTTGGTASTKTTQQITAGNGISQVIYKQPWLITGTTSAQITHLYQGSGNSVISYEGNVVAYDADYSYSAVFRISTAVSRFYGVIGQTVTTVGNNFPGGLTVSCGIVSIDSEDYLRVFGNAHTVHWFGNLTIVDQSVPV